VADGWQWSRFAVLGGILVVGAAVPGISVLTVAARTAGSGFRHGAAAALGIAAGDVVFILLAVHGLAVLAAWSGSGFLWFKLAGGAWLVWLGWCLWQAQPPGRPGEVRGPSLAGSFAAGLAVTLADQKAILFYLAVFPALFDLPAMAGTDVVLVVLLALVAVGGTKLAWAVLVARGVRVWQRPGLVRGLNRLAGGIMVLVGTLLWVRLL